MNNDEQETCKYCHGTKKIEIMDVNNEGTGKFRPCPHCAEDATPERDY